MITIFQDKVDVNFVITMFQEKKIEEVRKNKSLLQTDDDGAEGSAE